MVSNPDPMDDTKGYLTTVEMDKLLEAAAGYSEMAYVLICFLSYTGRRISEVIRGPASDPDMQFGVKVENIDFSYSNITYRILKKNPRRRGPEDKEVWDRTKETKRQFTKRIFEGIPKRKPISVTQAANPGLLVLLEKYIQKYELKPDDFLFPISQQRAYYIIKNVGQKAGITHVGLKPLHPHHFRHTFAVHITSQKISTIEDLEHLRNLLQHSNIQMTMNYLRYGQTRSRELVKNLYQKEPEKGEEPK